MWRYFLIISLLLSMCVSAQPPVKTTPTYPTISSTGIELRTFEPPRIYDSWWNDVEQCTGLAISQEKRKSVIFRYIAVDGFRLDGAPDMSYDEAGNLVPSIFIGMTISKSNSIIVVLAGVLEPMLVKHEMLHYVLWSNNIIARHPDANGYYQRCGLVRN
jgi:hypothetical protein